jgi:hypothetical protein
MDYGNNGYYDSVRDNENANENDNRNNNPNNMVSMGSNTADNIPNTKESSIEHNTVHTYRLLLARFELEL